MIYEKIYQNNLQVNNSRNKVTDKVSDTNVI